MKRMKKLIILAAVATMALGAKAQETAAADSTKEEGFVFTTVKENPITSVKNQNKSGTCWCFSGLGFLESEVLRMKGIELDLSEMFVVSHTMMDRATYFVRQYGEGTSFAPGGNIYDVIYCMENYGLCPQEAMPGIMYGDSLPNHNEVDKVSLAFLKALTGSGFKKLSPVWKNAFQSIWDAYLGVRPEKFNYNGKEYTPRSFVEYLGLKEEDYVTITSYTHHPFYKTFAVEVPDNWRMHQAYNVPLEELMQVIDNAIDKGYTMAWGADVSEVGFTRKGIGVMPDADNGADLTGSDMAHWLGLSETDKRNELTKKPLPELEITQEMRQKAYDNWETTDDHGMQIFGLAKDQNGKEYYMIKNSWGTQKSEYKGIWYISRSFMAYKTNDITVHKDALPKELKKKLGIK